MMKELLRLQADPHALSSSGGNLVWQCCNVGNLEILQHFLTLGVECSSVGNSQDFQGVSYTPLHIASQNGNESCVRELILARAEVNVVNELNLTPLDDAIAHCKADIVYLLVSNGAKITEKANVKEWGWLSSFDEGMGIPSKGESKLPQRITRSLDLLFGLGNPVVIAAAADGLLGQEQEVSGMSTDDLARFLTTPGDSAKNIIRAVFYQRDLTYWGVRGKGNNARLIHVHLTTAHVAKPQALRNGDRVEFMNVTATDCKYLTLYARAAKRLRLDTQSELFLCQLAPQGGNESTLMTPVCLFEGLVKNLHTDLRIIQAIAGLEPDLVVAKPCQAILEHCWNTKIKTQAIMEAVFHVLLLINFTMHTGFLQRPEPSDWRFYIRTLAFCGGMLLFLRVVGELLLIRVYRKKKWGYGHEFRNWIVCFCLFLDGCCLGFLTLRGEKAAENTRFLCAFAVCAFCKWMQLLYALTPFRTFGLAKIPILRTMSSIGPIFTVLIFHIFGLGHGYAALNAPATAWLDYDGSDAYYLQSRLFLAFVAFVISVVLTTTFVAFIVHSLGRSSSRTEALYQKSRANCILRHMAIREGFKRQVKTDHATPMQVKQTLWFSCASNEFLKRTTQ